MSLFTYFWVKGGKILMSYSIGELAKIVGMTVHGENEGLVTPKRQGKNQIYSEEDKK
ncbi:hypothetical protein TEHN7121_0714 [Tetragenococcus halophilus subsp. halophilus]|nr:hypothetical protein TEHN7121_0714 [Tetragenococcus halophilus subsp. halophilus]